MRVLVTGANGFIGKNLIVRLNEQGVVANAFTHDMPLTDLPHLLSDVDFVFHLAGINRPKNEIDFYEGNKELTEYLCDLIRKSGRSIPILYTSSTQAELNNPYGASKLAAEQALVALERETGSPVYIYRLPNVFGKWCKPNYNSVVATFCYNIANELPIQINDSDALLKLVYIDDVIKDFIGLLNEPPTGLVWPEIAPIYTITVGQLADQIKLFKICTKSITIESVGTGLRRALYSTYLSFLPPKDFSYTLPSYTDPRGRFVEMLRTRDSGQFSFFTAHSGITRGGHYHHSKNEKFLVIQGKARFGFRHILTSETYEIFTSGEMPQVVQTVPGWSHDITNIGDNEMIVLLWANEIFDRDNPDTIAEKV